jgi:hypothetical protein
MRSQNVLLTCLALLKSECMSVGNAGCSFIPATQFNLGVAA